jgi:hypothetical protein
MEGVLESYAEQLLASGEPVRIARALMVAGFSDECDFASRILSRFSRAKGFLGQAQSTAHGAYSRNKWSRHWYELMRSATTPTDFWRYSVLLCKIVDGRFDKWAKPSRRNDPFAKFMPAIRREINNGVSKRSTKLKDKLFGEKVPHLVYLAEGPV